jgi:hypothetical protein
MTTPLASAFVTWALAPATLLAVWPMLGFSVGAFIREARRPQTHPFWYVAFMLAFLWTPLGSWWAVTPDAIGLHISPVPVLILAVALVCLPRPGISGSMWLALSFVLFLGEDGLMSLLPDMAKAQWEGADAIRMVHDSARESWWFEGIGGAGVRDSLFALPFALAPFWLLGHYRAFLLVWLGRPRSKVP